MDDLISKEYLIEHVCACMENDRLMQTASKEEILQMIADMPSAQPEIIRCKDCKWWGYDDETGDVRVCHAAKHGHISSHWEIIIRRTYRGDFYCADAERRTDG